MKTFLKFLLALLIWTLIGAVIIGGMWVAGRPWQYGAGLLAGLMALWYGFKLGRWLWRRHQARQRVEQLVNVAPNERGLRLGVWRLWRRSNEKDERFLQVLQFLKSSNLRKHGDPLYVMPWYLLLGDAAAGKRELIANTAMPRPTLDSPLLQGEGRDIDWHLHNRGIVIETPDFYSDSSVSGSHEDWLRLLMQLEKYRSDEPVNGVVIAVSVATLQQSGADQLTALAMKYRRLLEDVVQILGVKVPVNVVVTEAQTLPGFMDWVAGLAPGQIDEALGAQYLDVETPQQFVLDLVKRVSARMREFNLLALRDQKSTPAMLRLPALVQELDRPLSQFVNALFEVNQYQEPQQLRGIYFSAQGTVRMSSEGAENLVAAPGGITTGSDRQTLFLHDLLTRVLPSQRLEFRLVDAASEARQRKKRAQALGWSAGVAVLVVAMGSLYLHDRNALREAGHVYARQLQPVNDLNARVGNLLAYHDLILRLGDRRFFPWLAPGAEPVFVAKMKEDLANRVDSQLVAEVDALFSDRLEKTFFADRNNDLGKAAEYAGLLVRRINILTASLNGDSEASLSAMPQPFDSDTFATSDPDSVIPLNTLYVHALIWAREAHPDTNKDAVLAERTSLQQKLDKVLAHAGSDLSWMVAWANASPRLKPYRVSEFWRAGSGAVKVDTEVPRAYTLAGKSQIDAFVEELRQASGKDSLVNEALPKFKENYRIQYLKAWENFVANFSNGLTSLSTREEWLSVINNLTTGRNIYFNIYNLVDTEIEPFRGGDDVPEWVALSNYYQDMRALGPDDGASNSKRNKVLTGLLLKTVGKAGAVGKMLSTGATSALKTKEKIAKASGGPTPDERAAVLEQAAEQLKAYKTAVSDFVYNAEVRSSAYAATTALFNDPENPAKGGTPYAAAYDSVQKLQALIGKETQGNQAFWKLYKAPLDLLRVYMLQEASCQLDDQWRNNVLSELEGLPDFKRDEYLRGESGILWTFMSTTALPFVRPELGKGYAVKRAQGSSLAIDDSFLSFVVRAKDAKKNTGTLNVEIHAFPSSLNVDARTAIRSSTVTVTCPEATYDLHNYNYPVSRRFPWTTACTGVTLEISLSSLTLQKSWTGPTSFAEFIREFGGGPKAYTANDFPQFTRQLRELGINEILMQFEIDGAGQVLQSVVATPLNVPQHAAACWAS